MFNKIVHSTVLVTIAVSVVACGGSGGGGTTASTLDNDLQAIISSKGLTGDPSTGRNLPTISDAKAQLGMKLFFTKSLGGDQDSACVTCHHPMLGGGDDLSLPVGVNAEVHDLLGPGRRHSNVAAHYDGGPTVPRNAPTTYNIGMWDKVLFHDGRVESLTGTAGAGGTVGAIRTPDSAFGVADPDAGVNLAVAQARFPVTSPEEMRGFVFEVGNSNDAVRTHLQARLNDLTAVDYIDNSWLTEFRTAFNDPTGTAATLITFANIVEAIGTYERSQVFVDTPWKAYVNGDVTAISEDAKKGALLFYNSTVDGGANCASCHSGDFFTDEEFHVIAMPQIGRGKGDGINGNDDFGRIRETGATADMYAFRTPSLINVEITGPYGHAGAYMTLENTIRHHLNAQNAIDNYDFNQLDPNLQAADMKANTQLAMDVLSANRTAGTISPILEDISLTDTQVGQIIAFLRSLTDPCVKTRSCLSQWIPGAGDTNPDSLRVNALDMNGDYL